MILMPASCYLVSSTEYGCKSELIRSISSSIMEESELLKQTHNTSMKYHQVDKNEYISN